MVNWGGSWHVAGRVQRLLMSLVIVVISLSSASVVSAEVGEGSYATAFGQHHITWGNDWKLQPDLTIREQMFESMFIRKDAAVLGISFFPSGMDLVGMRDSLLGGVKSAGSGAVNQLDAGTYDNVAYELDSMMISGVEMGVFTVMIDRGAASDATGIMFGAPVPAFEAQFGAAQRDVTVDGAPIFEGVDPSGLQELLGSAAPAGKTSQSAGTGAKAPSPATRAQASGKTYTNAAWGYSVTYAGAWSDGSGIIDLGDFSLYDLDQSAIVGFVGLSTNGMQEVIFFDVATRVFADGLPTGAKVVGQVTGQNRILLVATTGDGVFIQEYIFLPGNQSAVQVTLLIQGSNVDAAVASFQSAVSVNGAAPLAQWELIADNF